MRDTVSDIRSDDQADRPGGASPGAGGVDDTAFAAAAAAALAAMAARSRRQQADVIAALRGAGLPLDLGRIEAALRRLLADGTLSEVLTLADGGMIATVVPARVDGPSFWPAQNGRLGPQRYAAVRTGSAAR